MKNYRLLQEFSRENSDLGHFGKIFSRDAPDPGMTDITVDPQNALFASVDGVLFDKHQTRLIKCPEKKAGAYTIPDSVTSIGPNAFCGCIGLTNITIPGNVATSILFITTLFPVRV